MVEGNYDHSKAIHSVGIRTAVQRLAIRDVSFLTNGTCKTYAALYLNQFKSFMRFYHAIVFKRVNSHPSTVRTRINL